MPATILGSGGVKPGAARPPSPALVPDAGRLLLIEDDWDYGELVRAMLQRTALAAFEVVQVGRLAEADVHLADPTVGCVLLDLSLPDASGVVAVSWVLGRAPDLPVVVLTGRDDEETGLAALQAGAQDYLTKHSVTGPLLARAVRYAMERKRVEAELAHRATHDSVTGLPNRMLFLDRLEHALARCERRPESIAVLFLDLDRFKVVNESLGHEAGDELLGWAAERLGGILSGGTTLAHLGSDEFGVLCEDLRDPSDAFAVGVSVTEAMRRPFPLTEGEGYCTVSTGIAVAAPGDTPATLLRHADTAMYRAKQLGRDRFEVYDRSLGAQLAKRRDAEQGLQRAMERNELRVYYQPLLSVTTGRVVGAEALLRWEHPDRRVHMAAEFVPEAEASGLLLPIGAWALREACRRAREWLDLNANVRPFQLWVNLSARQLASRALVPLVAETLEETRLRPNELCLEVTENAVMLEPEVGIQRLRALADLGVTLAIDDFGTGYSSLAYLRRLPVRLVKLDRSFVQGLGRSREDEAIATAVVSLAHTLGKEVVAEGVERPGQLERLRAVGCDYVQGFYLLPPQDDLVAQVSRRADEAGAADAAEGQRGLVITFGREAGFVVLRLVGNLDRSTSAELSERLSDVIDEQGNLSVMLDLAGVRSMDRNGAQILGAAWDRLRAKGGALALTRPTGAVHKMLGRFGLADLVRGPSR